MVPLGCTCFFGRSRLEPVRACPALRGRAASGSRVGLAGFVRTFVPVLPWGHSGPPRAGDIRRARRRRWAMCACVRLAARGGLVAASRCAWPPCGGRAISTVHSRRSFVFSVINLLPRCLHAGDCEFGCVSYTQSLPRLGLAARSRVATHPGVRGFCHWADMSWLAAKPPSHQAEEPPSAQSPGILRSPCPHRS